MLAKYFGCFILLSLLSISLFAQEPDKKESENVQRQRFIISQIVADVPNLKLGENRAFVYAKLGTLACKSVPQDAQPLFQRAVNELIGAQEQAESSPKRPSLQNELGLIQNSRTQILNLIASCDAGLALDALYRTRSAAITKAIAVSAANNPRTGNDGAAQNELNLEQTLMRQAAAQDPDRAVKLLNDALKKGISSETLELLTQLSQKDPAAAQAAASDVMDKLLRSKFMLADQPNYQQIGTTTNFLNTYINTDSANQTLKFDDSQMRDLAGNLVSFYLQRSERYGAYVVNPTTVVQIAEKLVPGSVEALKQKQHANTRNGDGFSVEYSKLISTPDTTPETLVTEAKRLPANYRNAVYQNAASRYAQRGELDRGMALLTENLSDDALDQAMQSIKMQYANTLMYSGKYAEAEALIDQLPEYNRSASLLNLANVIYQNDPETNKSYALSVLGKARSAISDRPENSTEFSNLMQIIAAYGNIAPDEAFRSFESIISQMNELADAYAIVNQFQGGGNMRQGEYLLSEGISFGLYYDQSILRVFVKNDFDRTMKLIDGFSRREIRLSMLLFLAENANYQEDASSGKTVDRIVNMPLSNRRIVVLN
ncbi:MAG TPA: hypothetical protein VL325_01020 [Pyrinomonadaceae bacterium]|nr:hypothetical protein [Pyrinomonadaceae bacterium]